jgi:hypothetical protein
MDLDTAVFPLSLLSIADQPKIVNQFMNVLPHPRNFSLPGKSRWVFVFMETPPSPRRLND